MNAKTLWLTLGSIAASLAATAAVRRARSIRELPSALRHPLLWFPSTIRGPRSLRVGRALTSLSVAPIAERVTMTQEPVAGGLDAFVYTPEQASGAALLWIHGGGTIAGAPEGDHTFCSDLAKQLGMVVVSVRYRLAPEHPFPAGHDDCFAALKWMRAGAEQRGIDPNRIAVGGASAGGGLAAGIVQRAVAENVPVAFQALIYPMIDDRTTLRRVSTSDRGRFVWTPGSNDFAWESYLAPGHATRTLPDYAAPGRHEDLAGLPPTWIGVGDLDLFLEEDLDYARHLEDAGVDVDLVVVPGMYHGADRLRPETPAMRAFHQSMTDSISRAVGGES